MCEKRLRVLLLTQKMIMHKLKQTIGILLWNTAIRYIIGWWTAAFLDIVLLYLATDTFGIYYLYSQVIAFVVSCIYAYFFQKFLTFRDYSKKHLSQWFKFVLFAIVWLLLNLLIMYILVDMFHIHYLFSAICAKCIVFFWNFSMNKWFNFS